MKSAAQRETIFYSRFPDIASTPVLLPSIGLVTIHRHRLTSESGRFLVFEWTWNDGRWYQVGEPVNVASLTNAREYAPPPSERRQIPDEQGVEAWIVGRIE